MITLTHACFALFAIMLATTLAAGEEFLIKPTGLKYLGWRISKEEFKTCKQVPIPIGDAKIVATQEKCATKRRPPHIFTEGEVEKVNPKAGTFEIKTGGETKAFVAQGTDAKNALKSLEKGDKVDITYSDKEGKLKAIAVMKVD